MAYGADIDALLVDHHWDFDGDSVDSVGSVVATDSSVLFTGTAIAEDATNCMTTNTKTDDRVSIATTSTINSVAQTRKAVGGWFQATIIQPPPKRIYGEGDATTNFQFVLAYGNVVMFEATEPTNFNLQIYGPVLVPGRSYHLCAIFEGSGYGNEARFYVDGVEITDASPTNRQPGTADLNLRGVAEFGDPAGTVGSGEQTLKMEATTNGYYNHWFAIDGADAILTDTEVREELFEKGALPDITITTGTEAVMQTNIDTYADTLRDNAPLCIRVPANTGDTDFSLDLDNITFDPLASIHIQYTGTGTLTLVNTNGSDCSITSSLTGTIILATQQTLTVTAIDATTSAAVVGARVYLEADTGGDLTAGTVIMNEVTDGSGIATTTHSYTADQPVIGRVRKGTASTYYKTGVLPATLISTPLNYTALMLKDE